MKKAKSTRILALTVALCTLLAVTPTAAEAQNTQTVEVVESTQAPETKVPEAEGTEPKEPTPPAFPDVTESDWFYDDVMRLSEKGIINGYPDGAFRPTGEITNAEFVKLLMVSIGTDISGELDLWLFSEHWASAYISYAYKHGIITDEELINGFDPSEPITRASMTKMMILALGIEDTDTDSPFSDTADSYACAAYKEYLLRGYLQSDGTRICNGEGNALRSEASAIIARVISYLEAPYEYKKEQILKNAENNELNTKAELIDLFYILNREFIEKFTLKTSVPFEVWEGYYRHANLTYLEYYYSSSLHCAYDPVSAPGVYELKLVYDGSIEDYKQMKASCDQTAEKVISAIITDTMSDSDKIKAIHDYLVLNCAYDYDNYTAGTVQPRSRLAIGVFKDKLAVCQGYTAAFNLLCRKAGLRTIVVKGTQGTGTDDHAWNIVLADGQPYHVDVTHDDPVPDTLGRVSYRYFMLTDAQMTELGYNWDGSCSDINCFN